MYFLVVLYLSSGLLQSVSWQVRFFILLSKSKGCTLKKKSTSFHDLFWCFKLSQIEDSIQYLVEPNGIWKDHERHIGVHLLLATSITFPYTESSLVG